ncbi:unnamed protein product [Soboliphyme baturini]|uniref:MFS domain-containing protein n=1 Tax=Soboliphyme baturini TaxID=241478 RepID=A0A183IGD0_9BILA|nr:unnamed protein product [Soboliphyme baturini]
MDQLRKILSAISVEPILFLNFFGFSVYAVCLQSGIYQVLCRQITPNSDCQRIGGVRNGADEDKVQAASTFWFMMLTVSYLVPALLSDTFLGALGDRQGRKTNILIGLAGMLVSFFPAMIVFSSVQGPMWLLMVFNMVSGFTGFIGIVIISAFAYLADTVPDHDNLTVRMVIMGVVNSSAMVIGSFVASTLLHFLSFSQIILFGMVMICMAFFYAVFRIEQVPPLIMRRRVLNRILDQEKLKDLQEKAKSQTKVAIYHAKTGKQKSVTCSDLVKTIKGLLKDIWVTFTKRRPCHHRMQILIVSLVFFLHVLVDMGLQNSITTLFLFRRPFSWTAENLAFFRGVNSFINMVGGAVGVLVFKKVLHFRESTILLIALVSCTVERLWFTFSTKDWMVYTAVTFGCMSTMVMPTMKSFAALLVQPEEVGKMYMAFGLGMDMAHVVSAVLFNSIYERTSSFFPGMCFLIGASISFFNIVVMLYVSIDEKRCNRVSSSTRTTSVHF